jgi:hypothetical protein
VTSSACYELIGRWRIYAVNLWDRALSRPRRTGLSPDRQ